MTTIYLMRHGHAENPNQVFYGPEFGLSDRGRRQVANLGQEMKAHSISPVLRKCSPFPRALETCEIVTGILGGSPPTIDGRLVEWDAGPWFNKPSKDFYAATHYGEVPPRIDDPHVEPLEKMAKRVIAVIEETRKEADGASALLTSHREPLVSALLALQGLPWDTIHDVRFPVASVWELTFSDTGELVKLQKTFDHHEDA